MGADRLMAADRSEAVAERRRAEQLATHLADSCLESRQRLVGESDVKHMLGLFARDVMVMVGVIRDGGDVGEFERRLAEAYSQRAPAKAAG